VTESAAAVEVRFACRVGGRGLATVRRHPQNPELIRVAVGATVRFTIAAEDAAAVAQAAELARMSGYAVAVLADGEGFYLQQRHRPWHQDEELFRLSIGSPLRRWLWRSELAALAAVLAHVAQAPHTP
jgi:hypothetical protein